MQALIALPDEALDRIFQPVGGVPLLVRVLATAAAAGVESAVLAAPPALSGPELLERIRSYPARLPALKLVSAGDDFDPHDPASQAALAGALAPRFLWLPWNLVTSRPTLLHFLGEACEQGEGRLAASSGAAPEGRWRGSAALVRQSGSLDAPWSCGRIAPSRPDLAASGRPAAVLVRSASDRTAAEALVALESGKPTDAFYSNLNRGICRPLVRWIARTPLTANTITLAGLPAAALAAYFYSFGDYWLSIAGALAYFAAVELDEMDGMIARMKFQESPLGNKLENFVDFVTYLFLWTGIGIGLYRSHGGFWYWVTVSILSGTVMSYAMQNIQKKLATDPRRPQDHVKIVYAKFEADKGNPVSFVSRHLHPLTKKGSLTHSLLWLTVLNLVPVFFFLSMLGSQLLWIFGMYANRFFKKPSHAGITSPGLETN